MNEASRASQSECHGKVRADADLIAASRSGCRESFGTLVERYQDRVFNLSYRLTGNYEDAADAAQETFLKAFRNLDSFRADSAFYTWVYRIAVNTIRSRQRYRAVRPVERSIEAARGDEEDSRHSLKAEMPSRGPDPVEEASVNENRQLVEQAIARLDEDQRLLIVLRDIEGHNYAEIADLLDCPSGTIKSRLHRARLALKELLAPVLAESFGANG